MSIYPFIVRTSNLLVQITKLQYENTIFMSLLMQRKILQTYCFTFNKFVFNKIHLNYFKYIYEYYNDITKSFYIF